MALLARSLVVWDRMSHDAYDGPWTAFYPIAYEQRLLGEDVARLGRAELIGLVQQFRTMGLRLHDLALDAGAPLDQVHEALTPPDVESQPPAAAAASGVSGVVVSSTTDDKGESATRVDMTFEGQAVSTPEVSIEPIDPQDEGAALYDIALTDISIDRMGYELRDGDDYGWDRYEMADQDLAREVEELTHSERQGLERAYRAVATRLLDLAIGSDLPRAHIKAALNAELNEGERLLGPNYRGAWSRTATVAARPESRGQEEMPVSTTSGHTSAVDLAALAEHLVLLTFDNRDKDRLAFARHATTTELRATNDQCSEMEHDDLLVLVNLLADLAAHIADQWYADAQRPRLDPREFDVLGVIRDRSGRGWRTAARHTVTRSTAVNFEPNWTEGQ